MVWAPKKGQNGWGIQGVTCRNWEQPCPGWQRGLPGKEAEQRQEGGAATGGRGAGAGQRQEGGAAAGRRGAGGGAETGGRGARGGAGLVLDVSHPACGLEPAEGGTLLAGGPRRWVCELSRGLGKSPQNQQMGGIWGPVQWSTNFLQTSTEMDRQTSPA